MRIKDSYQNIREKMGSYADVAKDVSLGLLANVGAGCLVFDATMNPENYGDYGPIATFGAGAVLALTDIYLSGKYRNLGKGKEV